MVELAESGEVADGLVDGDESKDCWTFICSFLIRAGRVRCYDHSLEATRVTDLLYGQGARVVSCPCVGLDWLLSNLPGLWASEMDLEDGHFLFANEHLALGH